MNVFNKVTLDSAKDIEKTILRGIWIRRYRLPLFILAVLLLIGFSHAPYVNLFLNSYLIIFVSAVLAPFILDIDDRLIFAAAIVLFTLVLVIWFTDRDSAEAITIYIFIILFSGVVKSLFSSGKI